MKPSSFPGDWSDTSPDDLKILTERRAPVQAEKDMPAGTISWTEHEQAWKDYNKHYAGQSADRIAERGGFGYAELVQHLGRIPYTWRPLR